MTVVSATFYRNVLTVVQLIRLTDLHAEPRHQLYKSFTAMAREPGADPFVKSLVEDRYLQYLEDSKAKMGRKNVKMMLGSISNYIVMDWHSVEDRSAVPFEFPEELMKVLRLDSRERLGCSSLKENEMRVACLKSLIERKLSREQALYARIALGAFQELKYLEFDYLLPELSLLVNCAGFTRRPKMIRSLIPRIEKFDYFKAFPLIAGLLYAQEYQLQVAQLTGNEEWMNELNSISKELELVLGRNLLTEYPKVVQTVHKEVFEAPKRLKCGEELVVVLKISQVPCERVLSDARTIRMLPINYNGVGFVMLDVIFPVVKGSSLNLPRVLDMIWTRYIWL